MYSQNVIYINETNTYLPVIIFPHVNCSVSWRKQYQIPGQFINFTNITTSDNPNAWYRISLIPKGTFTYWLHNENTKNLKKLHEKVKFADKYTVKQYIVQYKSNSIHYAQILYDFDNGYPSFEKLKNLSETFNGFVLKPNHFSGEQFIVEWNETLAFRKYKHMMRKSRAWIKRKYRQIEDGINREPWYELIRPHVFIEENLNGNPGKYSLTEYKFHVFDYKALFCYCHAGQIGYDILNLYTVPKFKFLNVKWAAYTNRNRTFPIPSKANLDIMINFAEQFARREQFRYVRVDLYEVNNMIYFSEFTFSPISGRGVILPISFDYLLYNILCDHKQEDIEKIDKYVTYRDKTVKFGRMDPEKLR